MLLEAAAHVGEVHVEDAAIVRVARGDHHVIDGGRELLEETIDRSGIGSVEGGGAQRAQLACGALQRLGIASSENQLGAFGARLPGCFKADAGAAADDNDGLAEKCWFVMNGRSAGCGTHDSSSEVIYRGSGDVDPRAARKLMGFLEVRYE